MPQVTCWTCGGSGEYPPGAVCNTCNGSGEVSAAGTHSITEAYVTELNSKIIEIENKVDALALPTNVFFSHKIWEATDVTEFAALSEANKDSYRGLVRMGTVDLNEGSNSRTVLWNLFNAESDTRAALLALLS